MEKAPDKSLFQMGKAIQLDRERLQKLEAGILPGAPNISDAEAFSETLAALKDCLKKRIDEYLNLYRQMYNWVEQVDDPYAKQLFTLLYIEGDTATTIARKTGMTPTTVRSDLYRYRKKYGVQWKAKHPRMSYRTK